MKFEIIQRILQSSSVNNYLESDSIKRAERLLENYQALIKQYKNCALGGSAKSSATIHETLILRDSFFIGNNVKIGRNVRISGNVYISDNCIVNDDCFLRDGTVLAEEVKLGRGAEIKSSIILEKSQIGPLSFIGDSLIGCNCFLGALVRTSNFRLDEKPVQIRMGSDLINCNSQFGCLVGDKVSVGLQSSIMPGRALKMGSTLAPGSIYYNEKSGSN
tara:strand:- start:563 stop:1216 length:654 start_codon:yes stop_codon:yes gene_type:complete